MRPAPAPNREVDRPLTEVRPEVVQDDEARRRGKALVAEGDAMFSARQPMLRLWQDIAETFYVERADFTAGRNPGAEFASHLMTGFPLQARQDLANAIGGMLRPPGRDWFALKLGNRPGGDVSQAAKAWMEETAKRMRAAMYEASAGLQRATKQADNDYVAFGNAVISVEANWRETALLFRCWHLRDVVWREDFGGRIDEVHRRSKLPATDVMALFPRSHAPELAAVQPEARNRREVELRHIVLPAERFGDPRIRHPFVSVYVDVEHGHVMEALGQGSLGYVIPRWQLVSGSVYGYSPTTVASISDARMLQDMTRTILEAGEKAVDPPMVATQEAVRSDLALYAGGVTYVDAAYDERLGAALRPIGLDKSGLPLGRDMQEDVKRQIASAWMLNKLTLPEAGGMTAFEVGQRIQEFVRQALPLFEPIEAEYNAALCRETFAVLSGVGAFGPREAWPMEAAMGEIAFKFVNPFTAAGDGEALNHYETVAALLARHQGVDPDVLAELEPRRMFRDAVKATGAPARWLKAEAVADRERQTAAEARQAETALAQVAAGGKAAAAVGDGVRALADGAAEVDPTALASLMEEVAGAAPAADAEEGADANP